MAWALSEASRAGVCDGAECSLADWARADLIGLVAAVVDLMLQCIAAGGRCGPPNDDDDGGEGGGSVGGRASRGVRRPILSIGGRRAAKPRPVGRPAIGGAAGAEMRPEETRASEGAAARRLGLAEWVARVRRGAEC
ncbi:MAG: hypothetical protein LWW93_14885 [Hyphomicrobiales bacterium]|nr:hypothetical protein [Hyphomicrobiales bacterium]